MIVFPRAIRLMIFAFAGSYCLFFLPASTDACPQSYTVIEDGDDGTELESELWFEQGFQSSLNYMGKLAGGSCGVGLRFLIEDLEQAEEIAFARLRFPSTGGDLNSKAVFLIEGVLQESSTAFSQDERPSQKLPKTSKKALWTIDVPWDEGNEVPLYYSSPDIAPILNEVLALPGWGSGPEGKSLVLTVADRTREDDNYVAFNDFHLEQVQVRAPAILEIYKTVYDTFLGKELLGRPSRDEVTVNLYSLVDTECLIEYGIAPDFLFYRTDLIRAEAGEPIEFRLTGLRPDSRHYYRLLYRKRGAPFFNEAPTRTFRTQRPPGKAFRFAVMADEHIQIAHDSPEPASFFLKMRDLYKLALANVAASKPDFLLSLGDFALTETAKANARNEAEAVERYLLQRQYLDPLCHSIPFFLTLGNHEGEMGWHAVPDPGGMGITGLCILSTKARKQIIPNPYPDGFYSGNQDYVREFGLREDYFAWEWGDALFVVLSPYGYTKQKPAVYEDGWLWTLGKEQYDWLHAVLHRSDAKWKFVFIHQLTSTAAKSPQKPFYGRGGIEIAKYKVASNPSFEWGGEDESGKVVFDQKRPGWSHGPVHDLLVSGGVDILFHGHDHFFGMQELDGIVYQECPTPNQPIYGEGHKLAGMYVNGVFLPNSGHLVVTVNPDALKVEYIRAFLPGDGVNGEVAYVYEID